MANICLAVVAVVAVEEFMITASTCLFASWSPFVESNRTRPFGLPHSLIWLADVGTAHHPDFPRFCLNAEDDPQSAI